MIEYALRKANADRTLVELQGEYDRLANAAASAVDRGALTLLNEKLAALREQLTTLGIPAVPEVPPNM